MKSLTPSLCKRDNQLCLLPIHKVNPQHFPTNLLSLSHKVATSTCPVVTAYHQRNRPRHWSAMNMLMSCQQDSEAPTGEYERLFQCKDVNLLVKKIDDKLITLKFPILSRLYPYTDSIKWLASCRHFLITFHGWYQLILMEISLRPFVKAS